MPGIALSLLCFINSANAASGTWVSQPVDNDWYNPANWSSGTVPAGFDVATFGTSDVTEVDLSNGIGVQAIVYQPGADAFTITAEPDTSSGLQQVTNNSSEMQNFAATTGNGSAASYTFLSSSSAIVGPVTFTQQARNSSSGAVASVAFENGSAGGAIFHNLGANIAGGLGGRSDFFSTGTSAGTCTVLNEGGTAQRAGGGATTFSQAKPSAASATLVAYGGTNGGEGGSFTFQDGSDGGAARAEIFGNGVLSLTRKSGTSFHLGSMEGDGQIYLGEQNVIVGGNNLSTIFSGVLHPGSADGSNGTGALTKVGTGTLTLTGANLYTAGTTVSGGTLVISNTTGSGTGTSAVSVNAGTLGGKGIIAGSVTVGTGSGAGATLAPAHGTNQQATLTIQSSLTFKADSTYIYTFKAKSNKARTDQVVANGVTISGAIITFQPRVQGTLTAGTMLTVINNTSANPISGAFSNLADDAILTANGNNFQANYEGGDGNNLTLTVVP